MQDQYKYIKTQLYRVLEHPQERTEDLYLIACGVERCLPGYSFGPTSCDHHCLHFILKGRGILEIKNHRYALHAGQIFLLRPGVRHFYQADEKNPWIYCWVTFDGAKADSYLEQSGFPPQSHVHTAALEIQEFYNLIQKMMEKPEGSKPNDLRRIGLLFELMALVMEDNGRVKHLTNRRRANQPELYIERALDYMQSNYATASVDDVARFVGISRSYLANLFKEYVQMTPQNYLMNCRMTKSAVLLERTNLPIQEIAIQVGYENPLTFSKVFRSTYDASPREYRGLCQQNTTFPPETGVFKIEHH